MQALPYPLSDELIQMQASLQKFCETELIPHRKQRDETKSFPKEIWSQLGALGILGITVSQEYGGAGLGYLAHVIAMEAISTGDAAIGLSYGAHSNLCVNQIDKNGTHEQKQQYLPGLCDGSLIGALAMRGPGARSDVVSMKTTATATEGGYLLNGSKMWITNAPIADIAVVWAKNEAGRIHGLIVERGMEGFTTPKTHDKWSLRASETGELVFDNVKVPKENMLPNKSGLGAPLGCLDSARYGIAWGAIGAAMDCYDSALRYSQERIQFGKPIASYQLIQKKLAEMITEITKAQWLTWRLGVLKNEGRATTQQISMAKRNNVNMAIQIAREARQIHGAMGITGEYSIMRHMMNLESVITYEGTHDIHLLITGMDVTGISAFRSDN